MAHRGNVSTQASSSFLHLARSFNLTQMFVQTSQRIMQTILKRRILRQSSSHLRTLTEQVTTLAVAQTRATSNTFRFPVAKDSCEGYSKRIRYLKAKADYLYSSSLSVHHTEYKRYSMKLKRALFRRQMLKEKLLASSKNTKRFFSYYRKNLKLADSIPNLTSQ
ncbi:hypothetical protein COOONC_06297, partial [Cooperia oncophora]